MSFGDWLASLFGGSRKRDISRLTPPVLEPATAEVDEIDERVDVSGGPLKEHHRRRALRDKRLLPKVKSPARQLGLTRRKQVLSFVEAGRLFGGTMRSRNRNLRDLLTDEDQLQRYDLPVWRTEQDLAAALGISLKELWFFGIHRERETQPHYVTFSIPKRSGGRRRIMAPKRRLKRIHRDLLKRLVEKLPVNDCAHAFRSGRSVKTGAEPHVAKACILKLDLKDFFPSVTFARVRGLLIAYGYGYPVATVLAVLMTEAERQPVEVDGRVFHVPISRRHCVQGAPTSPGVCNALLLKLDRRLAGLAARRGLVYTRYADDLTFSGHLSRKKACQLLTVIGGIIDEEGFTVNGDKTRIMVQGSRQTVTGVVVNETLGLSRPERRRLRARIHHLGKEPDGESPEERSRLQGKLAYLSMLNADQAAGLQSALDRASS